MLCSVAYTLFAAHVLSTGLCYLSNTYASPGRSEKLKDWWEYGKKREDTKEEEYIPLIDTNYIYTQFHASSIGIEAEDDKAKEVRQAQKNSYWIARMLILRLLGLCLRGGML